MFFIKVFAPAGQRGWVNVNEVPPHLVEWTLRSFPKSHRVVYSGNGEFWEDFFPGEGIPPTNWWENYATT